MASSRLFHSLESYILQDPRNSRLKGSLTRVEISSKLSSNQTESKKHSCPSYLYPRLDCGLDLRRLGGVPYLFIYFILFFLFLL